MSTAAPLTITGGLLVAREGKPQPGSLRAADGRIVALGNIAPEPGDTVIAAKGALIAPGLVDLGVFSIDKPAFHFGGITRAALMPDQSPPLDRPSAVRYAAQSGKPDLWVHPLAAAIRGLEGGDLAEIALMRDAGARAVATGRGWIADSGTMLRVLRGGRRSLYRSARPLRAGARAALLRDAGAGGCHPCRRQRADRQCRRHCG